ncbi:MAG TPA: TlpA disulfide reductase family protein [Thermoanaerobaculia bacterium]|nr:TlpA disulfide reductase family protein [Thermoanaerobaculia bacterium]
MGLSVVIAGSAFAADVRPMSDAKKVTAIFPASAKVRVLNVWATWCAPCVAEMPDLRALDGAFGDEMAVVGVSLDDMIPNAKPAAVASFLDKQQIAYPNVYYTGETEALGAYLKMTGEIPLTIVYDRSGNELWRLQGQIERDKMLARLRDTLRRMQ